MGHGHSSAKTQICCDLDADADAEAETYDDDSRFEWLVPEAVLAAIGKGAKMDSLLFQFQDCPPLKIRFFPKGYRTADDRNCSLYIWSQSEVTMQLRVSINDCIRLVPEECPERWSDGECKGFHNFCAAAEDGNVKICVELVEPEYSQFEVVLDKSRASTYGMQSTDERDRIKIDSVRPGGLIATWNADHPKDEIRAGDYIVEANGARDDPIKIRNEMLMDRKQRIGIKRLRKGTRKHSPSPRPEGNEHSEDVPKEATGNTSTVVKESTALSGPASCYSGSELEVRYLPTHIKEVQVLKNVGLHRWRADRPEQPNSMDPMPPGVAYRHGKDLKHVIADHFLMWGETVQAYDQGDGWVKLSLTEEFDMHVRTLAGSKLGIDTFWTNAGEIRIERVYRSGLVPDWNATHPDACVQAGDYVVEVNGTRDNCAKMISKLKSSEDISLKVTIRRSSAAHPGPEPDLIRSGENLLA